MSRELISLFLKEIPLFALLTDAEFSRLLQGAEYHKKSKYDFVYMPDEMANKVFFLRKGCIKIGTHSGDGKEVIKTVLYPNAMFGELCLVGEPNRIDFAQCMNSQVEYCAVDAQLIRTMVQQNLKMSLKLYEMIGRRLISAERRLESLVLKDARARIIDFIKDNVRKYGQRVGYEMLIRHSLTQQDIANITGTSRQTVTSVLNDLKKSNLIYFNRRSILVRDMAKLA